MRAHGKRRGFALVTAALFSGVMIFASALALREARSLFDEKLEEARRLRAENAAAQAAALAGSWLKGELGASAGELFSPSAAPKQEPLIALPQNFFSELEKIYPDYDFSCVTADLYYAPSFSASAAALGLPFMPPRRREDGSVVRYFMQKTSASGKEEERSLFSITRIFDCSMNAEGEIVCGTENETY